MLGVSHAVSGMALGAATLPLVADRPAVEKVGYVAVVGGFALLPDLDQGGLKGGKVWGSTAARTWGPFTALASAGVGRVAEGHRFGTHSFFGVAVFTLLAVLASLHPVSTSILVALAVGLALRAASWLIPGRHEKVWPVNLAVSVSVAYALTFGITYSTQVPLLGATGWTVTPVEFAWLPLAVALGMLVHIAGDMLTPEKCPLFWLPKPVLRLAGSGALTRLSQRRFGVGWFTTSTPVELFVVAVAAVVLAAREHEGATR